ncbi:MAG TPA: serine--tRNA ligase [Candidatus Saccharimonadales bacterium]
MLDIQFIRDNPDRVAEKSAQKGYKVDIPQLLGFDKERRELLTEVEALRQKRNELNTQMKGGKPTDEQIAQGREMRETLADKEHRLDAIEEEFIALLKQVPNMPLPDVPVGASEDENVVAYKVGEPTHFDFQPKSHWELAEAKDLIDKERAAKVAGARFAYIKGDLVKLQFAIIQFVLNTLSDEKILQQLIDEKQLNIPAKPFTPVLPPAMIRTDVFAAMDRLEPRDDRYKVGEDEDDLWLQGSAEHTLGSMYKDEILDEAQLPIRYIGYSSSFRREAGTYGKDTEGILRMHQFDKLEMEVFSTSETGHDEHKLLAAIQEYLVQQLGLPYQVVQKCTADIGKPNATGVDIETWMPGQNKYRETHTADFMTDYQARRLKTRVRKNDGALALINTNDATAFALGRIMIAIIENYQTAEGNVRTPAVLQPYLGGLTEI